jgi:hypothetical protein
MSKFQFIKTLTLLKNNKNIISYTQTKKLTFRLYLNFKTLKILKD